MISVITPVYNEADGIEKAVTTLRERLSADIDEPWELIVVNDGSTDDSLGLARDAADGDERVRVVSYDVNRGRGYALRRGFAEARGDVLVTIESDLTWGEDVVRRMVEALRAKPEASLIIASPHLDGGGYEVCPLDIHEAFSHAMAIAVQLENTEGVLNQIQQLVMDPKLCADPVMQKTLAMCLNKHTD